MSYLIQKILDKKQVEDVKRYLDKCQWDDGLDTVDGGGSHTIKKNKEASEQIGGGYKDACSTIFRNLEYSVEYADFCVPTNSGPIIFSKTTTGGYYKPHHDHYTHGHYSNTLFLSDPSEYEGGELCLFVDQRVEKIKLEAGMMITYDCGIPHQVSTVTSGERNVAVFWTESQYNDRRLRQIHSDVVKACRLLGPAETFDTIEESQEDPRFILEQVINNLGRLNENW